VETNEPVDGDTSGIASARSKFSPDGAARRFPGSTIISPVASLQEDTHSA
jgi:hypothetical protein